MIISYLYSQIEAMITAGRSSSNESIVHGLVGTQYSTGESPAGNRELDKCHIKIIERHV